MTAAAAERRHVLVKVAAGDYVLLSNDGRTLWRFVAYEEDGSGQVSADGKRWRTLRGTYWNTWRCRHAADEVILTRAIDPDGYGLGWDDFWEFYSGTHETRALAVDDALRAR